MKWLNIIQKSKRRILLHINNAEQGKELWRRINSKLKPNANAKLDCIHVRDNNNNKIKTINSHEQMCHILLDSNQKIMREGEGCLPTTDNFKSVFGTMGGRALIN